MTIVNNSTLMINQESRISRIDLLREASDSNQPDFFLYFLKADKYCLKTLQNSSIRVIQDLTNYNNFKYLKLPFLLTNSLKEREKSYETHLIIKGLQAAITQNDPYSARLWIKLGAPNPTPEQLAAVLQAAITENDPDSARQWIELGAPNPTPEQLAAGLQAAVTENDSYSARQWIELGAPNPTLEQLEAVLQAAITANNSYNVSEWIKLGGLNIWRH